MLLMARTALTSTLTDALGFALAVEDSGNGGRRVVAFGADALAGELGTLSEDVESR